MRTKAFTLVEVMIVVAIMGLLAAIAIPSFVRAKQVAEGRQTGTVPAGCYYPVAAQSNDYYRFNVTKYCNEYEIVEDLVTGHRYLAKANYGITPLLSIDKLEKE